MGNVGPFELILIGLVVFLFFGAGRIADIGKGLGQGIKNFKQGLKDEGADGEKKTADAKDEKEAKPKEAS